VRKLAILILTISALVTYGASTAVAGVGDNKNDGDGGTVVTGGENDIEVIVENGGGEIVIETSGGAVCIYRKAIVGEVIDISDPTFPLPAETTGEFIRQIRTDDRNFYLYLQTCPGPDGVAELADIWIEETPATDVVESARQELIEIAPNPEAGFSPDASLRQLVGLATFVWLDETSLEPIVAEASIPGLTATATGTPARLLLDPGDGSAPLTCELDVTPYVSGDDPESSCTHTYQRVSSISDTGTWDFTVTVEWDVTWVDSLGGSGTAEPLLTESVYPLTVVQAQPRTVNG